MRGHVSTADCPGPPARYTTISLSAAAASLLINARRRSILRPSGAARFSGTENGAQYALVVAPDFFCGNSQALNCSVPSVNDFACVAIGAAVCLCTPPGAPNWL